MVSAEPFRSLRCAAVVLASACALSLLPGGAAVAEPLPAPTPSPSSTSDSPDVTDDPSTGGDTVLVDPGLSLSPTEGGAGTSFTATATGFGSCDTMSFSWDDGELLGSTPVDSGSGSAELQVPSDASITSHEVVASCGDLSASAPFTVVAVEDPKLTLSPTEGGAGTQVTATATGFHGCSNAQQSPVHSISFQWDGQELAVSAAGADSQTLSFEVPADASADEHVVTATCGSAQAEAPFTVVATEDPVLTLDPQHGTPGSRLTASGTGFVCGVDGVSLLWQGEDLSPDSESGTFEAPLTVPLDAIGTPTVRASCRNHPEIADETSFTVEELATSPISTPVVTAATEPTTAMPPTPPPEGSVIWIVALIVAAVIVALLAHRYLRKRRATGPNPHVHAVSRPGEASLITMREMPASGEVTHAIRLEARPDSGIQTIREVDDDHSRT